MDHLRLPLHNIDVISFIVLGSLFVQVQMEVKVFFQEFVFPGVSRRGEIYKSIASKSLNMT